MAERTTTWTIETPADRLALLADADTARGFGVALTIDPRARTAVLDTYYGARPGDAMPAAVWHGLTLRCDLPATLDPDPARATLTGAAGLALLDRIAAGHTVGWDGSNHVGRLTDDARDALDALEAALQGDTFDDEQAGRWDAAEWLEGVVGYTLDGAWVVSAGLAHDAVRIDGANADGSAAAITAATPDADLAALADRLDAEARDNLVVLVGTAAYLRALRDGCAAAEAE